MESSWLSLERQTAVLLAKLAEEAERYNDMMEEMKKIVMLEVKLTAEERQLLSVAYRNVVFALIASWRILSSIEHREETRGNEVKAKMVKEYREKVEAEIDDICGEAIFVATELLRPPSTDSESRVFYNKMLGDHNRYIATIKSDCEVQHGFSFACFKAYEVAMATAQLELPCTNPIRLAAALNYSVYYYEIVGFREKACEIANKAFDDAICELDNLNGEALLETMNIMRLLRDNVILWTAPDIPEVAGENAAKKDGGGGAAQGGADQAGCSYIIIDD